MSEAPTPSLPGTGLSGTGVGGGGLAWCLRFFFFFLRALSFFWACLAFA